MNLAYDPDQQLVRVGTVRLSGIKRTVYKNGTGEEFVEHLCSHTGKSVLVSMKGAKLFKTCPDYPLREELKELHEILMEGDIPFICLDETEQIKRVNQFLNESFKIVTPDKRGRK